MDIPQLLYRFQTDKTSGASTLQNRALDILERFATHAPEPSADDFHGALEALLHAILAAQPSMAPLLNLANQALQACPACLPAPVARQRLRRTLTALRRQARSSTAALCRQALAVLPPQATVLTYSNSATVVAALCYAHARGHVRRVLLSESRPAYDGRQQAAALLAHGMAVEYGVDMALFDRIPEAQVILVGADAVLPQGLINKLGTHALAQVARLHNVPCFSLCTATKFLPDAAAPLLHIADHPAQEVWPDAPASLLLHNRYFDRTPLDLLHGIVSETGLYTPTALRRHLQQQAFSPTLREFHRAKLPHSPWGHPPDAGS